MSDNPLMQKSPLDVSPEQERRQAVELLDRNETSLLTLQQRKAEIHQRAQDLDLDSKEKNLEALEKLNQNFVGIAELIGDPNLVRRVTSGNVSGRDLKAISEYLINLQKVRKEAAENAFEVSAETKRKKKIEVAFAAQGVQVAMRVETDE